MIYTSLTKKAMLLCFKKHKNQVDKCGIPYPFHPFHVTESMTDEYSTCVALLHDIVEDTDITIKNLTESGFPKEVVEAIELMTHNPDIPYLHYIRKIKSNLIAKSVKISDLTRLDKITHRYLQRAEKYKRVPEILNT